MAIEIATVPGTPQTEARRVHGRPRLGPLALILLLTAGLGAVAVGSLATGAVPISPRTILAAMLGQHPLTETQRLILFHIRLPRVLASGLVGCGRE